MDNTSDLDKPISTATQAALGGKSDSGHTHGAATTSAAGFMSAADKGKLDGVAENANNYAHPANHPPSIIMQDASNRFVTDAEKTAWNSKEASGTAAAAMTNHTSAADPHGQYLPKAGGTMSGAISFAPAQTWPIFNQSTTGNAGTATKLATARTIGMTGDVTWTSAAFDGSGNVTGAATLAASGATAGTYKSVTVDDKGRVTAGTNPTTLAGYGITDAASSTHNHTLDALSNVTITSNAAGEVLKWDGSKWINNTLAEAGIQPAIAAGTAAQVWRGDKTWVTLDLTYLPDAAFKKSVRAATTANLTASFASGVLTNSGARAALVLDGITLVANDRVLVKDQTTTAQNGIYAVTNTGSSSVAWVLTRVADADSSSELAGATVNVDSGTVNGGLRFDTDFKATDTINTAGNVWSRVVDTGMASTVPGAALGTAAVGTSLSYARADHVHAAPTTVSGNAGTATKLATARTINGVSFDGSANITINATDSTAREAAITAGTTAQYWRGDKTWRDLFTDVRAATLTGLSTATSAVVSATDTVLVALGKLQKQVSDNLTTLTSHTSSTSNPHSVTKAQVGLGNVDNTSDANKPVSTAAKTALNLKANIATTVEQADIGTGPDEVPLNGYLGDMAFQSRKSLVIEPAALAAPHQLGAMVFQLTNNTTLVVKVKGSDGTVRSATLTLA